MTYPLFLPPAATADMQMFVGASSHIWNKPCGASFVWLLACSGGGGGGTGGAGAVSGGGGGGGGTGSLCNALFAASTVPDLLNLQIGPGGAPGANGSATIISALGLNQALLMLDFGRSGDAGIGSTPGAGGAGGFGLSSATWTNAAICFSERNGFAGGDGGDAGISGLDAITGILGSGGGGGSGWDSGATDGGGIVGALGYWSIPGGAPDGAAAPNGYGVLRPVFLNTGGAGGGGGTNAAGRAGGNAGGFGSGGGGGGGGSAGAGTGGLGGAGSAGVVMIRTW